MKLQEIAAEMKKFAQAHPYRDGDDLIPYRRELPRGLTVAYVIDGCRQKLSLTRQGVAPSPFEEQICLSAFEATGATIRQEKNGGDYHHIIHSWGEMPAEPAPTPSPAPPTEQPPAIIAGRYYTAQGVVYRARQQRRGLVLIDVNRSWNNGDSGVVAGLFERSGQLYTGEYAWDRGKTRWQEPLAPSALTVDDLVLCRVVMKIIKFE